MIKIKYYKYKIAYDNLLKNKYFGGSDKISKDSRSEQLRSFLKNKLELHSTIRELRMKIIDLEPIPSEHKPTDQVISNKIKDLKDKIIEAETKLKKIDEAETKLKKSK
jgi:hypothetical protein